MIDETLIEKADAFAAHKHRGQIRKGPGSIPYIQHPREVTQILAQAGIRDPEILAASLLHDTVEDTDTTEEELASEFGPAVGDMVLEVTDDKTLAKVERKKQQVDNAPHLSHGARLIRIADKICNVRDICADAPSNWGVERKKAYLGWAGKVVDRIRGTHSELEELFDQTCLASADQLNGESDETAP